MGEHVDREDVSDLAASSVSGPIGLTTSSMVSSSDMGRGRPLTIGRGGGLILSEISPVTSQRMAHLFVVVVVNCTSQ